MSNSTSRSNAIELDVHPDEAMAALRQVVEDWGGGFGDDRDDGERDEFAVPIRAGLRQGYARFRPRIESRIGGSRLELEQIDQTLHLNRSAVAVLTLGAVGGVLTVLWPLHPSLMALAPMGALLALLAWLMVASRFRSQGETELLASVEALLSEEADA